VPGKIVRQVDDEDIAMIGYISRHYRERIALYKENLKIDARGTPFR